MKNFITDIHNGISITRTEFDDRANAVSELLASSGYTKGHRLAITSEWTIDNLIKFIGIKNVCSPVVVDYSLTRTERSWYDVDIWADTIPEPRATCKENEVLGLCSSGTTDKPRIIPWTQDIYDRQYKQYIEYLKLGNNEKTMTPVSFWSCFGQEIFNVTYDSGNEFVICSPYHWPDVEPTWLAGSPYSIFNMTRTAGQSKVHHIRTNAAPMPEHWYKSIKQCFDAHVVHCYGTNETGTATSMVDEWRPGSSGKTNPGMVIDIVDGEIVINGFKTGDLGYVEDDYLYITGRSKEIFHFQNGKKIMPYEIETPALLAGADDACAYFDKEVENIICYYTGTMTQLPDSSRTATYVHVDTIVRRAGKLRRLDTHKINT